MDTSRASSMSRESTATDAKLRPLNAPDIKSILTAAGWQKIEACQFVQTSVGESHSPVTPTKWYPALSYRIPSGSESGKQVVTPLSQIISFSEEVVSPTQR